jgi:UDP-2,3-diacylglucosamine pyrophosphatase LpxH
LTDSPTEPFPHDPTESPAIEEIYAQHKVFARHGDIFDPFNYEGDRDESSLGDAIVVELLNRFPSEVKAKLGRELPQECLDGLKEIDNVRPLLVIPLWIDGLLRRTCPDPRQIKKVKDIWDDLVDQFLKLDFVRKRDSALNLFDNVDRFELVLKFSKGVSFHTASRLMGWVKEKFGSGDSPFYQNAFTERAFKNRSAQHIVYGHTHHYEIVPLDSSYTGRGLFNQMYLNSGTWRRVHELAQLNPKDQEFMGYHVMTYLAFFKDDERKGRPFESWSGSLGV